ncbi:ABC transporter permease [Streptomyces flavofungini]|uniref:ABC transporter permease n=1 Tax=Streptomyces flavofungini TaxID=68200 RepID=A0ABS0XJN1_9ACTN|nr:ABC transporter permease [Streptomyces flavofungini]MBJ3813196.1 ABC transporter permease [Streptomyces flavofungini]GHC90214.1 amino acid ABC transporter permease [Streptomyces flavofungini]
MTTAGPAPRSRPPGRIRRLLGTDLPYQMLTLLVVAALWEGYARTHESILLPTFTETAAATVTLLGEGELWRAAWLSNQALVLGFLIAVALGVPAGLLLGRFSAIERYTDVYLSILLVTPMAGIIPLLVMSVGFGLASRVILVALFSVVMAVTNARAGIRQIDASLIEMSRTFGASEAQIWRRVLIPGAMPAIMTGVRLALGRAVTGMVIVELLMVSVGYGGLILTYRSHFDAPALYAVVVIVLSEAVLLISAARWIERKMTPWATSHHSPRSTA